MKSSCFVTLYDRTAELCSLKQRQPFETVLSGIRLRICEDVFPPDGSVSSKLLADTLPLYHPQRALDMGCGTGYLALLIRKQGARVVYATDSHTPAVRCASDNIARNPQIGAIQVGAGDLFSALPPPAAFDLIVFNQPLYPLETPIFGMGPDGGAPLIERFLAEARHRLLPGGVILMPFREDIPGEHDPSRIAGLMGLRTREAASIVADGVKHSVVEIKI